MNEPYIKIRYEWKNWINYTDSQLNKSIGIDDSLRYKIKFWFARTEDVYYRTNNLTDTEITILKLKFDNLSIIY